MNQTTKEPISVGLKKQIAIDLRNYVNNVAGGSANKASKLLTNVSGAYISHVLNDKSEALSDEAWWNIYNQVSVSSTWKFVDTNVSMALNQWYLDARLNSKTYGIVGSTGAGKTQTTKLLNEPNVFTIECNEYFTAKIFLEAIMKAMGKNGFGMDVSSMMREIIENLLRLQHPLIIIDEADKLNDKVLYFFISLYNALEDKCGLIIQATPYLQKRIQDGVLKGKKGYAEINSRIGRMFDQVPRLTKKSIFKIIHANGISDPEIVMSIYNSCEFDIRVIKDKIHANKRTRK